MSVAIQLHVVPERLPKYFSRSLVGNLARFSRHCALHYLLQDGSCSLDIGIHDCVLVDFCTVVLSITSVRLLSVLFYN